MDKLDWAMVLAVTGVLLNLWVMWRHVGKSDGVLFSTYACEPCQAEMNEACRRDPYLADDGLDEGCVRDWRAEAERQVGGGT